MLQGHLESKAQDIRCRLPELGGAGCYRSDGLPTSAKAAHVAVKHPALEAGKRERRQEEEGNPILPRGKTQTQGVCHTGMREIQYSIPS